MNPLRDCHLRNKSNIERAYKDICESLLSAAKQCILCGCRNNHVPCWDKDCETFYCSFTRAPVGTDSDRAASSLLSQLQQKQERWGEAVKSIDFSRSSRKAWRTINKLIGRSGLSFRQCHHLANSIASKLVKSVKVAHRTRDHKYTRLVNKQLSDLWKIPTREGHNISKPLRPEELAAALRRLKPESLWDWTPSSQSSYSTLERL